MHFLRRCILLASLLGQLFCGAAWAQSATPAGKIDLVGGEVQLLQLGKPARAAQVGDTVYEGDTLVTGKASEAHVTMQDSGFLALRPNTTLQIVSYTADGGDDDKGVFKLISGGLRSITGWIGKFNRKSYTLRTPTATIGIRGTDHETYYIPPGSPDGEPGTYDKVFAGETSIQTEAGQAAVMPDHAGYVSDGSTQQPRVLPRIPGFYRPGPHEDIINRKHAEIQQMIIQRRDERRKFLAEKLALWHAAQKNLREQAEQNKAAAEERKMADEAQHEHTEAELAAIKEKADALQQKQKDISELRRAIAEKTAPVLVRRPALREQMKAIRETWVQIAAGYKDVADARKALNEYDTAQTEGRKAAAEELRKQTEVQLAALNERGKALQERQKTQQELSKVIEEQAASITNASNAADRKELAARRQTLRDNGDANNKEQREYQAAMNALYETNMTANEGRMMAAAAQRHHSEIQLAALRDKEQAVQQKLMANEDSLEALQTRIAEILANDQALTALIKSEHDAVAALRVLRRDIQEARRTLHEGNISAIELRQQAALDQMKAAHAKHQEVREKGVDFMNERDSMQQEIRALFEQEQKRYQAELKADRQQGAAESLQVEGQ